MGIQLACKSRTEKKKRMKESILCFNKTNPNWTFLQRLQLQPSTYTGVKSNRISFLLKASFFFIFWNFWYSKPDLHQASTMEVTWRDLHHEHLFNANMTVLNVQGTMHTTWSISAIRMFSATFWLSSDFQMHYTRKGKSCWLFYQKR